MSTQTKIVVAALIVGAAIGLVLGHSFWPGSAKTLAGASPTGSTFGTRKTSSVTVNLANPGQFGTSTSLTNTDTNIRYVTSVELACSGMGTSLTPYTGAGLASLQLSVGTTSTSNPISFSSSFPLASNVVIGTSTSVYLLSSSTPVISTSQYSALWGVGVPMTFWFNATNTAVCTVGVNYIGS